MRAVMVMARNHATWLKIDLGDACAVFNEQDVLCAAVKDVQTALLVPFGRRRGAGFFVLQKLDGDIAEWSVRKITGDVSEVGSEESSLAVLELQFGGGLAFDFVGDIGGADGDIEVVMAVAVHERRVAGTDFYLEDADEVVLEDLAMMSLVGDFNFSGRIGREENRGAQKRDGGERFHRRKF